MNSSYLTIDQVMSPNENVISRYELGARISQKKYQGRSYMSIVNPKIRTVFQTSTVLAVVTAVTGFALLFAGIDLTDSGGGCGGFNPFLRLITPEAQHLGHHLLWSGYSMFSAGVVATLAVTCLHNVLYNKSLIREQVESVLDSLSIEMDTQVTRNKNEQLKKQIDAQLKKIFAFSFSDLLPKIQSSSETPCLNNSVEMDNF